MAMIIDGTNGLTFNNSTVQASAGQVLQVVTGTYGSQVSTTSTTFTSTPLNASITPKFATSKILIIYSGSIYINSSGNTAFQTIYRNSTNIGGANGFCEINAGGSWFSTSANYLDSPATTSSTTYTVYFRTTNSGNATFFGGDSLTNTITLLEIAA
jgi:hypothetical protein